jgi:hypothetical protein
MAKTNGLLNQAKKLGKSKYAPALEVTKRQRNSNRQSYDTASQQRTTALNAEMGSLDAANSATKKFLTGLKGQSGNIYQQAMERSQQSNSAAQQTRQQENTQLLSSMQAAAAARGLSDSSATTELASRLATNDTVLSGVGDNNKNAIERMGLIAQGRLDNASISTDMISNTDRSSARGAATSALDKLYTTYQSERSKLEGEDAKLHLEKQDYINQLYMTLKDKAAAQKAAKAQARIQGQIAAGNMAFKNTKLKVDTQFKYDKLSSDKAYKDVVNKLKAEGFSHKRAMDLARKALNEDKNKRDWEKFDWSKMNPSKSVSINLSDAIESMK